MRCYNLGRGRIAALEEIIGLSDDEAALSGCASFAAQRGEVDAFKIWDRQHRLAFASSPATPLGLHWNFSSSSIYGPPESRL